MNCSSYVARCNFENEANKFCNWNLDDDADFYWERVQGETSSEGTGPSVDHTYLNSTGHYLYIEVSLFVSCLTQRNFFLLILKLTLSGKCTTTSK